MNSEQIRKMRKKERPKIFGADELQKSLSKLMTSVRRLDSAVKSLNALHQNFKRR